MTPTSYANRCGCPTAILREKAPVETQIAAPVKSEPAATPAVMQELVIESQAPSTTNRIRTLAMDAEDFIRENIGLIVTAFAILISLVLVVLFTKPGKKIAAAVAG